MPIVVPCKCGKKLKVADKQAGKKIRCPGCNAINVVPQQVDADEPKESSDATPAKPAQPKGLRIRLILLIVGGLAAMFSLCSGLGAVSCFVKESNIYAARMKPRPMPMPGPGSPEQAKLDAAVAELDKTMIDAEKFYANLGGSICPVSALAGIIAFVLLCGAWIAPAAKSK